MPGHLNFISEMGKRFTQEEFLQKVKENNKNNIDLSEFVYVNNSTKGKVRCNVCNHEWYAVPMSLFTGHGCPKCAVKYKAKKLSMSNDEFVEKAKKIHGDKYDYSKVNYTNRSTKVCIICPKHGEFWQKPGSHLIGHGCTKCNGGVVGSKETFLQKVEENNKNDLNFDEFIYVNASTKGKCKCNKCGHEWMGLPSVLIKGHGCPKCSAKKRGYERRKPFKVFLNEYNKIFINHNLSFIESTYKTALSDMTIICPIHGEFKKTPNEMLNGAGCPICRESKLEREIVGFLESENIYFIKHKNDFKWLNKKHLDFYLPDYNIAIECQGAQHYKKTNYYGGMEKFIRQSKSDLEKYNLCNDNGIKILYYTDYKGKIPEIYRQYTYSNKEDLLNQIKSYGKAE